MIRRYKNTKHGYYLWDMTNDEFRKLQQKYPEPIRCAIVCQATADTLRCGLLSNNIITINNKVPPGIIFLNHRF